MPSTQTVAASGPAVVVGLTLLAVSVGHAAEPPAPDWGRIGQDDAGTGRFTFAVTAWPEQGRLAVPAGFPQIVRATAAAAGGPRDLLVEWTAAPAAVAVLAPPGFRPAVVKVETGAETGQFADGRIVLTARSAVVEGATAKIQSQPGNHRVESGSSPDDSVSWTWRPTRWGAYDVLLTHATAAPAGAGIEVAVGETMLAGRLESTGSQDRYATLRLGRVHVPATGPLAVRVRWPNPAGNAALHVRAVTLAPACEGAPPRQDADGSVLLHGRDATILGTTLRWEPADSKQTLGFWTRPTDAAEWTFVIDKPGTFDVEVLQGCGTGQEGSEMRIDVDPGGPKATAMAFTVDDTGGFQAFRPRTAGRVTLESAGDHLLRVQPRRIAKGAACDIRQIRLLPVDR